MPVLAIFASMTKASKETNLEAVEGSKLQGAPCIYYLAQFGRFSIEALIDSGSKVHTTQPSFVRKLGLRICKTDVGT